MSGPIEDALLSFPNSDCVEADEAALSDADFKAIAEFRAELRRFLRFSEEAARSAGVTPQQHQLLLAVRGWRGEAPPSVGDIATALQVRHNSAVGLIDRSVRDGLVERFDSA